MTDQAKKLLDIAKILLQEPVPKKASNWRSVSIAALRKGIAGFARKLEAMGLEVEMESFAAGRGEYGASYVHLTIDAEWETTDEEGDTESESSTVYAKFLANGISGLSNEEFGGGDGIRTMKTKALAHIMKSLTEDGWTPPAKKKRVRKSSVRGGYLHFSIK